MGANGLLLLALVNQRVVVEDALDNLFVADLDRVQDADDLVRATSILVTLLGIAIAVVFIIWMWRAAKNNEALGRLRPRLGPGWAIGGWFIPLANFVLPILMLQDLWRGADASIARGDPNWREARGSALTGVWWGGLVASVVARFASGSTTNEAGEYESLSAFRTGNTLGVLGAVCAIVAAVLAISVVRGLSRRQDQTLVSQQAAWQAATPSGPPGAGS